MKKVLFSKTPYCRDKRLLNFMRKYGFKCEYLYKDNLKCYSANQQNVKISILILRTDYPKLLGNGKDFYGKYRILRSEFRKSFGINAGCGLKDNYLGILVYPNTLSSNRGGMIKNSNNETPLGFEVENIEENSDKWLLKLRRRYGAKYTLKTKKGEIIGPEEPLLLITNAYLNKFNPKVTFEIGAGTGEVSAFILRNTKRSGVYVNEKSPYLREHLKKYLKKPFKKRAKIILRDIHKIRIPKADLIISGIFYGELPTLIKGKGQQIKKSLGKSGLFVIQSGMLENMFALAVIDPLVFPKILEWGWCSPKYNLRTYFNYVFSFFLRGELITLASQNKKTIMNIVHDLSREIIPIQLI